MLISTTSTSAVRSEVKASNRAAVLQLLRIQGLAQGHLSSRMTACQHVRFNLGLSDERQTL